MDEIECELEPATEVGACASCGERTPAGLLDVHGRCEDCSAAVCDRHGRQEVVESGSGSGFAGGRVTWDALSCGCYLVDESDDMRAAR